MTRILACVLLEAARAGVAGAVDLDREPELRPVEVDLVAAEPDADARLRQVGAFKREEEAQLGAAARAGAAGAVKLDGAFEAGQAWRPFARSIASAVASRSKISRYAASWRMFVSS